MLPSLGSNLFNAFTRWNSFGGIDAITLPNPFGASNVKQASRDRILAVADEMLQKLGFSNWEEGLQFASKFFDKLADKISSINTREKFDHLLSQMPEPSPGEFDQNIAAMRKFVYQSRNFMLSFSKELPHSPGGRPRSVPSEKHEEVCREILALIAKHVPLSDAFERVAQQQSVYRTRPVSARTIERIWQQRKGEERAV